MLSYIDYNTLYFMWHIYIFFLILDSVLEDSFDSMKIYYGDIMERIPDKHYVNDNIE